MNGGDDPASVPGGWSDVRLEVTLFLAEKTLVVGGERADRKCAVVSVMARMSEDEKWKSAGGGTIVCGRDAPVVAAGVSGFGAEGLVNSARDGVEQMPKRGAFLSWPTSGPGAWRCAGPDRTCSTTMGRHFQKT